jgi:antitoxin component of RelBE/YafQ-DinJ toxin-antitoxin module
MTMPKKSESLIIRISPETKAVLAAKAQELGMTMSEYVRLLVLEDARGRVRTAQ